VNFFGHAAIAAAFDRGGRFAFGAMLPDFYTMIRRRRPAATDPDVQAGIALHHETDLCFHRAPDFVTLVSDGTRHLTDHGVRTGVARAASHVGVELLLDGMLLPERAYQESYLAGLGARSEAIAVLDLDAEGREALAALGDRLANLGIPHGYRDPVVVGDRLARILAPRPRLSPSPHEDAIVRAWLIAVQPDVGRRAAALVDQTHRMLR
jgi:hypothetical protein